MTNDVPNSTDPATRAANFILHNQEAFDQAVGLIRQNQVREGCRILLDRQNQFFGMDFRLLDVGMLLWQSDFPDEAILIFRHALDSDDGDLEVLTTLARSLIHLKRWDEMIPFLERLRELQPDETEWDSNLAASKMFSATDVFALSYPKCGRTWARLVLGTYALNGAGGDPLEVYHITKNDPGLSTLNFTHDDYPHWKPFTAIHTDKSMYKGKKVVFFVRDPRDVLVSYFFQYTLRGDRKFANDPDFDGSLSDFIHYPIGGLQSIVRFYNVWADKRGVPDEFLLMRYEDMHADPLAAYKNLIGFIGWPDHGDGALAAAVAFGDFDNMKMLERNNTLNSVRLKPPEDDNPEGFKVRRGKVGGYVDYFSEDDTAFVNDYLERELDDFYGAYKSAP